MHRLYRRGLWLEYFTVGYNIAEAAASIIFGAMAGSIALIGFGLDSVVESLSGGVLIWRLKQHEGLSREKEQSLERRAVRFVAVTLFLMAGYVLFESLSRLISSEVAEPSAPGIIIALLSLVIMPLLARQKTIVGKAIGSRALIADASETLACAFLSGALLLGLGANYFFGFWQADPIAGMIVVIFLIREGWEAWQDSFKTEDEAIV